jgi:hypothetical protein
MEKLIMYCGQKAKIACDEKCNKAWGWNTRPKIKISDKEDDFAWLSDEELDEAPINPGTYEDGIAKPIYKEHIPNKWCVRECERCKMSRPNQWDKPLILDDFSKRIFNIIN